MAIAVARGPEVTMPPEYEEVDGVWYLTEEDSLGQGEPHYTTVKELGEMLEGLLRDRPESRVVQVWDNSGAARYADSRRMFAKL